MERGVRFTALMHVEPKHVFFSFDEVELHDDAVLEVTTFPVLRQEGGVTSTRIPVLSGLCRVDDSLFLIGGISGHKHHPTLDGLKWQDPSNWLWSAPLPTRPPQSPPGGGNSTDSSSSSPDFNPLTWTGCATMDLGLWCPMVVPLYDGKIFICGGFRLAENWVIIYDPLTQEFNYRDAPGNLWMEHPNSCFLWWERDRTSNHHRKKKKKQLVMVYYHHSALKIHEEAAGEVSFTHLGKDLHPQLFSYDVESNSWETFADNLPAPRPGFLRQDGRNLIYVGGDILFIIDSSSLWFVYDLSVKEMVGKVEVNGLDKDRLVIQAFYLGSSYNVDGGIKSMTFCTFSPDEDEFDMGYHDIAYAKVQVQLKGRDYVAEVLEKAIIEVGYFCGIFFFADQTSRKRAAEEETAPLGLGGEEDQKKMEL